MSSRLNRRSFIKRAALTGGAVSAASLFSCPTFLHAASLGSKLNCALVGCGNRGKSHLAAIKEAGENLFAVVDPIEKQVAKAQASRKELKVEGFNDYRQMFDKVGKHVDAVFVAAPNHQHALVAMTALQLDKGVYCEKPLTHDIAEARNLAQLAAQHKVPTQMGNQGHCQDGYRRLCEYVDAGVLGNVTEAHCWTNRANGGRGPRPPSEPVPAGIHWDNWIGPAPYRDYHTDLQPHEWHGWHDFGNGSLGNLACHVMDGVYWALKIEHPTSIEALWINGGTDERYPVGSTLCWDIPARGSLVPMKVYWYDGRLGANDQGDHVPLDGDKKKKKLMQQQSPQNFPPLLLELKKQYPNEKFDSSGSLYVGEKGIMHTGCYGENPHFVPKEKMKDVLDAVPRSLPRPESSFNDFLRACREGKTDTATPFSYGSRLTEFTHLGNLAQFAGQGKKVEWDGAHMQVTNLPDLNKYLSRKYRNGWGA